MKIAPGTLPAALAALTLASPAFAYTAAGDRLFPATILLPQIGPADEFYVTGQSQPVGGGRDSVASATYDKAITDRFGIGVTEAYGFSQATGEDTVTGWQNTTLIVQYTAVIDRPDEFLLSFGFEREFGGTGAEHAGADPVGATTPLVYFGKGLGDADATFLRPFAVVGNFGYELADTGARTSEWTAGLAIEYSIPYLTAMTDGIEVPEWLRGMTPIVEITAGTPADSSGGEATAITVAPGFSYAGEGWELGLEAQIPVTRDAGQGIGVAVQLHIALDYLFPETIGRPLL
jgi:hypothetical protein